MSKVPRRTVFTPSPHDREVTGPPHDRVREAGSAAETARYIAEFTAELSYLARQAKLDLLAYLLDMARLEASRTIQSERRKK